MKIKVNNSLFTDIELDKAANVNGGSVVGYWWANNPSNYRLVNEFANGVNSNSLAAFDRNLNGILSTFRFF